MRHTRLLNTSAVLTTFIFTACATTGNSLSHAPEVMSAAKNFSSRHDEQIRPFASALFLDGERNAVLNLSRLGLAAMETGQLDLAKKSLDDAIKRI